MKIYLASPLGFAASTTAFMHDFVGQLAPIVEVVNPWDDHRFDAEFGRLPDIDSRADRLELLQRINRGLGSGNEASIRSCDGVVAILDGVDVDSGTASEIGFAYGLGKWIEGLRTDFRLAGDNEGSIVNLQVQYFIEESGGAVSTEVDQTIARVKTHR